MLMPRAYQRTFLSVMTIISMLLMVFTGSAELARAASAPNIVTYQGRVLDANGVPLSSSSLSMKFFLYTASSGGTCIWSNSSSTCDGNTPGSTTARTVTLTNGLFTENLGDTSLGSPYAAIADSTFADNGTIHLEVIIAGETLSPRRMLTAAPYALNADTLDGYEATDFLGGGSLWETGVNGQYEDDAAVIVGADAAFSFASGGIGDLLVSDELEVDGAAYFSGAVTFGDNGDTIAINSSDWDISLTGDLSGIGSLTADGLFTGTAGAVISGAGISLNASSDFATNINTGTSTGTVTIGGGSNSVVINSSDWDIDATGNITGFGTVTTDGLLSVTIDDGTINSVSDIVLLGHTTTAAPDVGVGAGISFQIEDLGGIEEQASFDVVMTDVADGTEDARLDIRLQTAGTIATEIQIDGTAVSPSTSDGSALGTASNMWSDLFLASGAAIDFNSDVTLTHTADTLTVAGGTLVLSGALDANGDVSIADTNVSFDGASTTFTTTGAFTLTPGGAVAIGDGGDTLSLSSSDWTIDTTGNMTGIGSISANGSLTFNSVLTDITSAAADPITIAVGSANPGTNTVGGLLTLSGGSGDGAFNGGAVNITGGGSGTGATGDGGALVFTGGIASSTNGAGGAASFQGGNGTGTGSGGAVTIRGGAGTIAGTGTAGALTLDAGNPNGGTSAAINIGTSYASAINIGTSLLTDTAGENAIGSTSFEWNGLYIGDDGAGIQFGATQDVTMIWDDTAAALELDGGLVVVGTDLGGTIATGDGDLLVENQFEVLGSTLLNRVNISTAFSTFSVTGANGTEIISGRDAADSIYLTTAAGSSETIRLRSQYGTGADSITLFSELGGITINATSTTAITNDATIGGTLVVTGAASFDGGANPANAGVEALGTTALEWDGLYLGDDGVGVTFGADQDVLLSYVSASTDLNLALTDGNTFAVDGDGTPTATLLNIGSGDTFPAATTSNAMNVDFTAGAGDGADIYSALKLTVTSGNHAAATDQTNGLYIADLASADAQGLESGILIGSGWDNQIKFADATAFLQIEDGGYLAVNNVAGDTLFAITDTGDAGYATFSGGLSVGLQTAVTLGAGETTFDATMKSHIRLTGHAATNTLTNFTGGDLNGQILVIESLDGLVTFDCTASSLNCGSADFTAAAGDVTTWLYDGSWNLLAYMDDSDNQGTGDGFDIAEWYPSTQELSSGSVVVASSTDPVFVSASSQGYQKGLLGVVTTQPGLVLGSEGDSTFAAQVALAGRVPVNVTNENGAIEIGDYLTSSATRPGYAMKATGSGPIIGMSMEAFDGTDGQVIMHVESGWFAGDMLASDGSSTTITNQVVVAPLGTATATVPSFDSYGLALRGSAWDGNQAQAVEMVQQTIVTDENNYRLSYRNTTDTEVAYLTNTGTLQIAGDLVVKGNIYPSDRGTVQTNKYIYYDGSEGSGGDFMRTNAKGWSTGSYDFAEMFPSENALVPGEIVVFAGTGEYVKRSTQARSEQVAGIVSTRPGFLAGENRDGSYPIALAGRVPTFVSAENGEVKVGDPLASSSTPGYAMKATEPGMIVGYALEPLDAGKKSILTYVNVGYWSGDSVSPAPGTTNQASGFGSATSVSYASLNMTGNLYVTGHEILSVGRIAGISDLWSIEQDGTIKTEALLKTVIRSYTDEKVETIAVTSPEAIITLSGTSTLKDGQAEVRFEQYDPKFNDVIGSESPLRVVVTPTGPVSLYVSEKDNNHFTVKQFEGDQTVVDFDWMVTAYRKGYEPKPQESVEDSEEVTGSGSTGFVQNLAEESNQQDQDADVSDDQATPVSPDENFVDSVIDDEGDVHVEQPSDDIIEPVQGVDEVMPSAELSSVQDAQME